MTPKTPDPPLEGVTLSGHFLVSASEIAELAELRAQVAQYKEDAERYRWMKENVKRIPLAWEQFGWDVCIDKARKS